MTRMVNCVVLGREAPGLAMQTYPGVLGKRIFDNVSEEAWKSWVLQQTRLINDKHLSTANPQHRKILEQEMENFFFGDGSSPISNYKPM